MRAKPSIVRSIVQFIWSLLVCGVAMGSGSGCFALAAPPDNWASQRLLSDAADGELDDFELIDAALIVEGVEDPKRRARYIDRYRCWARQLQTGIHSADSPRQQATTIVRFLHDHVLTGSYDEAATSLSCVFENGRFNCVSSAILFTSLCEKNEIAVTAIRRPGHVACAVREDGKYWLVETTDRHLRSKATGTGMLLGSRTDGQPSVDRISNVQLLSAIYYNRAIELADAKEFRAAIDAAQRALRLDPDNKDVRANLLATINNWSVELVFDGRYEDASRLLDLGMRVEPSYNEFLQNKLFLHQRWVAQLWRRQHYAQAISILEKAGRQQPDEEFYQLALRRTQDRREGQDVANNQHAGRHSSNMP